MTKEVYTTQNNKRGRNQISLERYAKERKPLTDDANKWSAIIQWRRNYSG